LNDAPWWITGSTISGVGKDLIRLHSIIPKTFYTGRCVHRPGYVPRIVHQSCQKIATGFKN
jgi:hypothetical protein